MGGAHKRASACARSIPPGASRGRKKQINLQQYATI